ncbi:hypothetical protein PRO73_21370, partial [Pseudomonas aeruginosa]|uniref:hypothetical protein n=1 Tax=Pseudomonas aeruginosa TaxID=287 RepID=UPI002358C0E1
DRDLPDLATCLEELPTLLGELDGRLKNKYHQNGEGSHHFDALDKNSKRSRFPMQNQPLESRVRAVVGR